MLVLASPSEPRRILDALRDMGLEVVEANLETGDYVWFPHGMLAAIERKTVSNLLTSLASRQLADQMRRMVSDCDLAILMIEGEYRCGIDGALEYYDPRHPQSRSGWVRSGWQYSAVASSLLEIQLAGAMLEHAPVLGQCAQTIARIVSFTSRSDHHLLEERARPNFVSVDKVYEDHVWALCAFPGVGPEVARALLSRFGSLYAIFDAAEHQPELLASVQIGNRVWGARSRRFVEAAIKRWQSAALTVKGAVSENGTETEAFPSTAASTAEESGD